MAGGDSKHDASVSLVNRDNDKGPKDDSDGDGIPDDQDDDDDDDGIPDDQDDRDDSIIRVFPRGLRVHPTRPEVFSIVLTSQPTADVYVSVVVEEGPVSINPASVTFQSGPDD